MSVDLRSIIKGPVATERSTSLRTKNREYVFEVDRRATKHTIRAAVEKTFNVKVTEIRTMIVPGKVKRMGRYEGKTSTWKKAIIRLKKDQTIAMFENV
jgi:large subunit ribosomal protein L23